MAATKKEAGVAANSAEGVALTDAERAKALKEGATEDVKETGKSAHHALTDGVNLGEPAPEPYPGHDEIQMWAHNLDLGVEAFEKAVSVDPKNDGYIPDNKVYGLLALERNGQNRTPFVQAMMKRLKLKADQLPGGGPDYTNDIHPISKL